jgi:hypothetical protein
MAYPYGQSKAAVAAQRRLAHAQAELKAAQEEQERIDLMNRAAIALERQAQNIRYRVAASGDRDSQYGGRQGLLMACAEIEEYSARKRASGAAA